jgi:hypothetical protein
MERSSKRRKKKSLNVLPVVKLLLSQLLTNKDNTLNLNGMLKMLKENQST